MPLLKSKFAKILREPPRPSSAAVSYTHLDVYKRQAYYPWRNTLEDIFLAGDSLGIDRFNKNRHVVSKLKIGIYDRRSATQEGEVEFRKNKTTSLN